MFSILDETLDRWIREVAPAGDLTCLTLGLDAQPGRLTFTAREDMVVCGTEEIVRICASVARLRRSGKRTANWRMPMKSSPWPKALSAPTTGLESLDQHPGVRFGIASRTHRLAALATAASPRVRIAATCKMFPGTKELSAKAVLAGGGMLHRLGLSDSILVFDHHAAFFPTFEDLVGNVRRPRRGPVSANSSSR